MFVVTGAAGFVGYNFVKFLNDQQINNIIIIDNLEHGKKWKKFIDLNFHEYLDYKEGKESVRTALDKYEIKAIFHIGANADVLCNDNTLMLDQNYSQSKFYFDYCQSKNIPLIYASTSAVYGNSAACKPTREYEQPHNIYAMSKLMFDNFFRSSLAKENISAKVIGLRLFNIFGPGEEHKGPNASLPKRFFDFTIEKKFIDVFSNEIARDYVFVEDACKVFWHAYSQQIPSGIYNLGTGSTISHMEIAQLTKNCAIECGVEYANSEKFITRINMPDGLAGAFQFYTRAQDVPNWISGIVTNSLEKMEQYSRNLFLEYKNGGKL